MDEVLLNIFFAYSREDAKLRARLDKHLSSLKRKNFINTWNDGKIEAGTEWEREINNALMKADIILLLISADFIASDYCYNVEMKEAISRHEKRDAVIIPVLLHPCDWTDLPFSKIQGLPQNGNAVSSDYWTNSEVALSEVASSIKKIVQNLIENKSKNLKGINEVLHEKDSELRITLDQLEELEFEQEIAREENEKLRLEKKELEIQVERLKSSITELKSTFEVSQAHFQKLQSNEGILLNRLQNEKKGIQEEIMKLTTQVEKLLTKKTNIENDIKKIAR